MTHKHFQRDVDDDDRDEVKDRDAVWADAKVEKHRPALRPWHKSYWRSRG